MIDHDKPDPTLGDVMQSLKALHLKIDLTAKAASDTATEVLAIRSRLFEEADRLGARVKALEDARLPARPANGELL